MAEEHFEKLALFCNVKRELVIEERDVANSIYEVPIELAKQDLDKLILKQLKLPVKKLKIDDWRKMVATVVNPPSGNVEIAVVGNTPVSAIHIKVYLKPSPTVVLTMG